MSKIVIIIPVHNRIEYSKECLRILDQQKETRFFKNNDIEIIFVDDGSTDGTGDWIRTNYPEVIVLLGDGNLWYAGGVNVGMKYALEEMDPEFILVWENDIFPVDDYFDHLQVIKEEWDGNSIICSKVYFRSQPDTIFAMGGTFNPKTGDKKLIGRTEKDGPEYQKDLEVDWFLGQGFMIHKDLIERIGYMDDKNFPHYHSDLDYGLRAKNAGIKNIVFHKLKILNDTATTGISHKKEKTLRDFMKSFTEISSNLNIKKDIIFQRKHTTSILAYRGLIRRYYIYIGSFVKWKVLGWFGIKKKEDGLY